MAIRTGDDARMRHRLWFRGRLKMACRTTLMDDGSLMFICGEGMKDAPICRECGNLADNLCDFPIGADKTCDGRLCEHHSLLVMENTHYCPAHAKEYGLFQPVTKPSFLKPRANDNSQFTDKPPPKRRRRLPRRAA